MEHELCAECDKKTGRAGIHDDSLYIGEIGPLCEECHDRLVCKTCGGSGKFPYPYSRPGKGYSYPEGDGPCPSCNGTGEDTHKALSSEKKPEEEECKTCGKCRFCNGAKVLRGSPVPSPCPECQPCPDCTGKEGGGEKPPTVHVIKKLDNIRVNLTESPLPGYEFVVYSERLKMEGNKPRRIGTIEEHQHGHWFLYVTEWTDATEGRRYRELEIYYAKAHPIWNTTDPSKFEEAKRLFFLMPQLFQGHPDGELPTPEIDAALRKAFIKKGMLFPETEAEVAEAEKRLEGVDIEIPESLSDAGAVFDRIMKKDREAAGAPLCSECSDNGWNGRCPKCGRFTTDESLWDINQALIKKLMELERQTLEARGKKS